MDPNLIAIRRVYTRETGELDPDPTLSAAVPVGNEIVVEWEAGAAANSAGPFTLEILTHDVTDGDRYNPLTWTGAVLVPPAAPAFAVATDGLNHHGTYEQVIPFGVIPPVGRTYEITAVLLRLTNTVSFAKWMFFTHP